MQQRTLTGFEKYSKTTRRAALGGWVDENIKARNRERSRVRAKVEHSIGVVKRVFGFQKVRYRGPAKNLHRLEVSAALANLFMVRRQPLRLQG
jgi:transposase, IS5 family